MSKQLLFTEQLRAASSSGHAVSTALVVAKLMVAFTDKEVYGMALGSFYHVYLTIEQMLYKCKYSAAISPITAVLPRVERHKQIEQDLDYFLGSSWKSRVQPSPPAQRYLARLGMIAEQQPHLLIAHSFAMHSALMAGGQLTKRMLTKHVQLKPGKGTSTFDYQEPVQPLRAEYKQIINRLPEVLSCEELEEVLQEHRKVFEYNIAIIRGFHVGYRRFISALQKLIPSWLYLAGVCVIVAAWFTWYFVSRSR